MPSPFPGMDPYIESAGLWEDFHAKLIGAIEVALSSVVPDTYSVHLGERSYIVLAPSEDQDTLRRQAQGDVAIVGDSAASTAAATATLEAPSTDDGVTPVTMRALESTEHRETFVEIHQVHPQRRLVTTIEVLSPANKRGGAGGWQMYCRKRDAFLAGHANFVEIDLLRCGVRMPMEDEWPDSYLLLSRKREAPVCKVWPAHFRRRVPEIPVPLEPPDADISLDLQPLIDAVYDRTRYWREIDYGRECEPPLPAGDAQWLAERLKDWTPR